MAINKILLFIIIANIGLLQAQYTAIPDACFEDMLILYGIDTLGNYDGQILTSDIENITILDVTPYNCNIHDLTGIEDFTALEELYCPFNSLTSLNISNNHSLKKVICTANNINSFISSSNNVALEDLEISNNNLTNISLTHLVSLKKIGIWNNLLNNLDVSSNINIQSIACSGQNLTSIDLRNGNNGIINICHLTNSPNLDCVYVDDAQYSQTNWTDVDSNITFVETEGECEALGVNYINLENNFLIYPNPVKDILNIENNGNNVINEITIYDFLGKIILQTNITTIDISNTKKGLYLVKIVTKKGVVFNKKIIKIDA